MSERLTCTLCGGPHPAGVRGRMRHLRAEHPIAFRALVFRLVVPWLYLTVVLAFLASSLPVWVPIVALMTSLAVGFELKRRAAVGMDDSFRPTLGQMLRAGGYGAIALFALFALVAVLARG
jgi:hypothetical protein